VFIDYATIRVRAGSGGSGCCSFRREKNVPRGGPDGGHGGDGGDIVLHVDPSKRTLIDFRYRHLYRADNGGHGQGKDMHGKNAASLLIGVPSGTVVRDADTGEPLGDLVAPEQTLVIARGGHGGRGNAAFTTSTNRAPRRWEPGQDGEERHLELELKLLADVGLIGQPNAGKSTLLSRLSDARPKIGDYPFTTLEPNLGIVRIGDYESFVLADIPGLIEGAHTGKGLGIRFLRHIERTRILLFLLDINTPDPVHDFNVLVEELHQFNPELLHRPTVVALNKVDLLDDPVAILPMLLEHLPAPVLPLSAVTGQGIPALLQHLAHILFEIDRKNSTEES